MWILTANKLAKFHTKRLNQSENIPKSFRGATFFETPCNLVNKHVCKQRNTWHCKQHCTDRHQGREALEKRMLYGALVVTLWTCYGAL